MKDDTVSMARGPVLPDLAIDVGFLWNPSFDRIEHLNGIFVSSCPLSAHISITSPDSCQTKDFHLHSNQLLHLANGFFFFPCLNLKQTTTFLYVKLQTQEQKVFHCQSNLCEDTDVPASICCDAKPHDSLSTTEITSRPS